MAAMSEPPEGSRSGKGDESSGCARACWNAADAPSNTLLIPPVNRPGSLSLRSTRSGTEPLIVTVPPVLATNVRSVGWLIEPVTAVKSSVSIPPPGASTTVTSPKPSPNLYVSLPSPPVNVTGMGIAATVNVSLPAPPLTFTSVTSAAGLVDVAPSTVVITFPLDAVIETVCGVVSLSAGVDAVAVGGDPVEGKLDSAAVAVLELCGVVG